MALDAAAEHRAFETLRVAYNAVTRVVACLAGEMSGTGRLVGTGALQCLDLALLVDGQHHGVGGRIHIKAHNSLDYLGKGRVAERLNVRIRCGCRRYSCQIRCTERGEILIR
jgi:hypothetical protein